MDEAASIALLVLRIRWWSIWMVGLSAFGFLWLFEGRKKLRQLAFIARGLPCALTTEVWLLGCQRAGKSAFLCYIHFGHGHVSPSLYYLGLFVPLFPPLQW